ncbi:hypothetical protein vBEliSR6L_93 [Erythrobacter phage vB_EliS_R6L]|nr:hypothetical protein vBEliSR6L_93 [Erythrobacter phage vB_EliS_R6L]
MATKRRLKSIRLDKIAAVDLPCQEHATVAIVKRAPAAGAPPAIVKKTFQEALRAQLVSDQISETFWRAFENQWAVRDAFRTALSDEIAEGGDGSVATEAFTEAMGQLATAAADAARNAASTAETDLESAVEEAVTKYLQQQEQTMKITTKAALASAVAGFAIAKSTVADANNIIDAAVSLDDLAALDANEDLAKMAEASGKKKKKGDDTDAMKALQRENAVLKMAPAIRKHFDGLAADAQDAFLAKSAADQQAEVDAANEADPVVHKCLDGTQIRKSDGAAVLAMAKRNDALSKEIGELREGAAGDAMEKRARTEFPNVALTEATDMLKAAAQVGEDTATGKSILKSLETMNKGRTTLFKSLGTTEAPEVTGDIQKARQDFDSEVAKVAREEKIGQADAMSKVRAERPDLFEAAYPETAAADEDA